MNIFIPMLSVKYHGGTRVLCELADYIANKSEHNVTIICPKGSFDTSYLCKDNGGVRINEINMSFIPSRVLQQLFYLIYLFYYLPSCKGILIANFFVTWFPCKFASLFKGVDFLYFVQDIESKFQGFVGSILNRFCNITYKYSIDKIVPANAFLKDKVEEISGRISPKVNYTVGLSEAFLSDEYRSDKNIDFCYFARAESWKRLDRFFELLLYLEKIKQTKSILVISQDEHAIREIKNFLETKALQYSRVEIISPTSQTELIKSISRSHFFFGTSELEGFYLPPLESMARYTIPILFPCGGPEIYLKSGLNGFFVEDVESLILTAESITSEDRNELFKNMRITAASYSASKSNQSFVEFFDAYERKVGM